MVCDFMDRHLRKIIWYEFQFHLMYGNLLVYSCFMHVVIIINMVMLHIIHRVHRVV